MRRSLAAATLAGALMSAPLATAQAATEQVAPVAGCVEFPIGAPGGCDFFQNILQLLSVGSSSLSGPKAS
ncbi:MULTISPECIES: hypothetical protein [Nocardia]|uniref:hypothetical protein n=1 Tax=Nocardia TaxID=1817 RepID=UPI0006FD0E89|nr:MULTISPECIES: hypothetical protein [Nocardia]KQY36361.1 hypothetical protein ASD42_31640 [Nocardia sp. Root136]